MYRPCKEYFPECICNNCKHKQEDSKCCIAHHKQCTWDGSHLEQESKCKDFESKYFAYSREG